ncbi:hypothetical protein BDV95DRAFT_610419 [Massariosphaeria phaeospora]|uniref:Fungal N-terminal domain-containing protein n=1 Tax=Massariosphaeria phaeospora TaxID=100035 RepID=A0A7C8M481_9PLEO|nr:hypothetical protein BDV95DRAFT_610419 [Massariosphaeria phaeospora]
MAEPVSIIASAIAIGAAAAQLSLALFKIAQTFKHAPEEILDIAEEMSTLSESLNVLVDVLHACDKLCKPKLFEQIDSIYNRFNAIRDQLFALTGASGKKLRRLKWFFNGPKAKSLLKKVESIKSALTLVITIVRLAIDESRRPSANQSQDLQQSQTPNRFRKVVESIVQANRLAIDRAERDNQEQGNNKKRHFNTEVQRWEADSHDTAIWQYQLVFSAQATPSRSNGKHMRIEPHSATVEDCDSDGPEDSSTLAAESVSHTHQDTSSTSSSLIVWNKATQPSSVVDRLLQSWTVLSPSQIQASRAFYEEGEDEAWRENITNRIQEYTKDSRRKGRKPQETPGSGSSEDQSTGDDANNGFGNESDSSDDEYQSAEESTVTARPPNMQYKYMGTSSDSDSANNKNA